ncbi:hypothetical protein [Kocuria rosea]|uniref:hypothetical protein n=1 Tax=Kocuria rosea TaxID=1275 RepID=UPI00203B92D4|nr:hypothetical protein [Kocuria rosea]
MSLYIAAQSLSKAWAQLLEDVNAAPGGTATNVMVSIGAPQDGAHAEVTDVVDRALRARGKHGVRTVANTLFPSALYNDPEVDWSPHLPKEVVDKLDAAANDLYEAYLASLPTLQRIPANRAGTYFSRMISWPGKTSTGTNQLSKRVHALRRERELGRMVSNASDIAVAGKADEAGGVIEEYVVSDTRTQGFPCLVHIDISVREGALSLLGVYRHWHLLTRGYGNLIGLARLQEFLCQQTGYLPGELAVVAGHANAEYSDYSGRAGVTAILAEANAAFQDERRSPAVSA